MSKAAEKCPDAMKEQVNSGSAHEKAESRQAIAHYAGIRNFHRPNLAPKSKESSSAETGDPSKTADQHASVPRVFEPSSRIAARPHDRDQHQKIDSLALPGGSVIQDNHRELDCSIS